MFLKCEWSWLNVPFSDANESSQENMAGRFDFGRLSRSLLGQRKNAYYNAGSGEGLSEIVGRGGENDTRTAGDQKRRENGKY